MSGSETPLTGGRVTAGVVRIGDTVHRPASGNSAFVRRLLAHLESRGFGGAPRFLGTDEAGRDMLSFLPGAVPRDLGPHGDGTLAAAAALLRRFHDAAADFDGLKGRGEVVCHNDWGPANTVFRDGMPSGMIDFDTAAPGSRLWDLGYSAFVWLDLGNDAYSGEEQVRRLGVFADGYRLADCTATGIAVHAVARQTALAAWGRLQGKADMADWAAAAAAWTILNVTERLVPTGYGLPAGD
ncbi:MAG: phosphotransferase [Bauldia sp.]|nr:phosphotransferase [Bauldia sp.]